MMQKILNLPLVASEHGRDVDELVVLVHALMGVLLVGWSLYFVYVLARFRASKNRKAEYLGVTGHASTWLEIGVVTVEAILLIGFAVPLWAKVAGDFPSDKDATVVRVVGEQFAWSLVYPGPDGKFGRQDLGLVTGDNPFGFDKKDPATKDNVVNLNELHVPVGKPVILSCSSKDVIHSYKVVPLRVTQDCIPGLNIPTHFVPTKEGKYQVICAQLCGNGHASMASGVVVVESADAYKKWLASKSTGGGAAASFE